MQQRIPRSCFSLLLVFILVIQAFGRALQNHLTGDFAALNSILHHGVFFVGDTSVTDAKVAELELSAMRCQDLVVGDIQVQSRRLNERQVEVKVFILELDMRCDLNYSYTTPLLLRGKGACIVESVGNSVNTTSIVETKGPSLAITAADKVEIDRCDAKMNVTDMMFPDGIVLGLAPVEALIRIVVERQVQRLTCNFLSETDYLQGWLEMVKQSFDMYPPYQIAMPLRAEAEMLMEVPPDSSLLDFQRESTIQLALLDLIYDQVTTYLTTPVDGVWRANSLIREHFLEGRPSYTLQLEDDLFLFEGSDRLIESTIKVEKVELVGLDSLTTFQPLRNIGSHTLQNEISFAMLAFHVHCSVIVRPSQQPDSYIGASAGNTTIVDSTVITLQFDDVNAIASFLVAADEEAINRLELGSLMQSEHLLPCILSTLFRLDVATLSVAVAGMQPPMITPFRSPGLERVFQSSLLAAMDIYQEKALTSLPAFFQKTVATSLGKGLQDWVIAQRDTACPMVEIHEESVMDLRDMLLDPATSLSVGGKGTSPYGDILSTALDRLQTRFWATGEDGIPKVNDALIRPITMDQSGTEGVLQFDKSIDLVNLQTTEFAALAKSGLLRASHPRFSNLDTVTAPVHLMRAVDATAIDNSVRLGSVENRTFAFSTDLLFQIDSGDAASPLAANNAMELTTTFQVESKANFLASFVTQDFLRFAMGGVMNINCWLATLELPVIQDDGTPVYPTGIELSDFSIDLSHLDVDVSCSSCTSRGFDYIPEIVATLRHGGVLAVVENRVETMIGEVVRDYWESLELYRHIWNARLVCPSNEGYNPEVAQSLKWTPFPEFSRASIETIVFMGTLVANAGMILAAKGHLMKAAPMDPLSAQADLSLRGSTEHLDWTNLDESLGGWAQSSLDEMRVYVSGQAIDEKTGESDIGANILARNYLDDGQYKLDLHGAKLDLGGSRGSISQLRFVGLDSMTEANVAIPIAPQTVQNQVTFRRVDMELDVVFDIFPGEVMTMQLGLTEVTANATLFAGLNWHSLGSAWLGSMLRTADIVQCVIGKLDATNITELNVLARDVQPPLVIGNLSEKVSTSLESLSVDFFNDFKGDVLDAVPKVAGTTIRETINHVLAHYLSAEDDYCKVGAPMTGSGLVDFRDLLLPAEQARALGGSGREPYGDSIRVLVDLLQEKIASDQMRNISIFAPVIERFALKNKTDSGTFSLGETISASGTSSPRFSDWVLSYSSSVSDVYIENYDSIVYPLKILEPVEQEAYVLNHSLTFGVAPKSLRLGARLNFSLSDNQGNSLENEIKVELELQSLTLMLTTFLTIDEATLFSTPLNDIQNPYCLLSSISTSALEKANEGNPFLRYSVSADKVALNISCVACQAPRMDELLLQLYDPGESDEEVNDFIASSSTVLENFVGSGFLQDYFLHIVTEAKKLCPSSTFYDPSVEPIEFWGIPNGDFGFAPFMRDPRMQIFNLANLGLVLLLATILFFVEREARKLRVIWLERLSVEHIAYLEQQNQDDLDRRTYIETHTGAMFRSRHIPLHIRWAVPIVLLLNIGLYMAAHISLLSYMNIEADIAGQRLTIDRFMEFSFFGAAMRTYWTGGKEMALMAIIFSGIWPYIKLVSALALWFSPPSKISVAYREKFFVWMEILTKLSIIDIAMMLLATATLLVFVSGPGEEFYDSEDLYAITIAVVPRSGFYCILIAQRLNRVTARFFLDYNEKIISSASAEFWRRRTTGRTDVSNTTGQTEESSNGSVISAVSETQQVKIIPSPPLDDLSIVGDAFEIARVDSDFRRRFHFVFDSSSAFIESVRLNYLYLSTRYHVLGGTVGAVLACFCVLTLFIIGAAFAPSISVDVKESISIALESDRTYAGAVEDFNVFRIIILALLKSRFVLSSTSDYVGLCILISLVIVGGMVVPAIQWWKRLKTTIHRVRFLRKQRRTTNRDFFYQEVRLRHRFELWKHVEIYTIAFCIANWQLSAVVAFFIHNYCQNLERFYRALSYVGLVDNASTNCFAAQASSPLTLIILFGSFVVLLVSFVCQMIGQYKRNLEQYERSKV